MSQALWLEPSKVYGKVSGFSDSLLSSGRTQDFRDLLSYQEQLSLASLRDHALSKSSSQKICLILPFVCLSFYLLSLFPVPVPYSITKRQKTFFGDSIDLR